MNVWVDLLERWATPAVLCRLIHVPFLPTSCSDGFVLPSLSGLKTEQTKFASSCPPNIKMFYSSLKNSSRAVWIPDIAHYLQIYLCIIAHTGPSGHRRSKATEHSLGNHFFRNTVKEDVLIFVRSCIHCLLTLKRGKVPRPFRSTLLGTAVNNLLQFHYI